MKLKKFAKSASAVVPGLAEKDSEKREPNKGVFGRDLSDLLAFQQTTIPTVVTDVASYLENNGITPSLSYLSNSFKFHFSSSQRLHLHSFFSPTRTLEQIMFFFHICNCFLHFSSNLDTQLCKIGMLSEEGLFRVPGNPLQVDKLKLLYNTGNSIVLS